MSVSRLREAKPSPDHAVCCGTDDPPGVVHDGVEAVGDGQHGAVLKLGPDRGLDQGVGLQVHGRRGFVQDQDLRLPQQSSGQTHELTLAQAVRKDEEGGRRRGRRKES